MATTWDSLRNSFNQFADEAVHRTEAFTDATSLRVRIKYREEKLRDQYARLGRLFYDRMKNAEDSAEDISLVMEKIDALRQEIDRLKEELEISVEKEKVRRETARQSRNGTYEASTEDPESKDGASSDTALVVLEADKDSDSSESIE